MRGLERGLMTFSAIRLLVLLPRASKPLSAAFAGVLAVSGLSATALVLTMGWVVGSVPGAIRDGLLSSSGRTFLIALLVLAMVALVMELTGPLLWNLSVAMGRRVEALLQRDAIDLASRTVGVQALHRPEVRNRLQDVRGIHRSAFPPRSAVNALRSAGSQIIGGLSAAILLGTFRWWAPAALAVPWLALAMWDTRRLNASHDVKRFADSGLRRSAYYRDLVLEGNAAKEVKIYGLGAWARERMHDDWVTAMRMLWRERRSNPAILVATLLLLGVAYGLVLGTLASTSGALSVGAITVYIQVAFGVAMLFPFGAILTLRRTAAALPDLRPLQSLLAEHDIDTHGQISASGMPADAIRFEGVSFGYPGASRTVFDELDLTIPAGQSLAIVGQNGVGKTTLVKLLARLYEPQSGRIIVDDKKLGDLDIETWRNNIAAIFQDFVRYPLDLRANVGYGALEHIGRQDLLTASAEKANAHRIVDDLPLGWETQLSSSLGGVDLSGGEWQRIGLARAFFAVSGGARILVMDEPTANLDVRTESELFGRFLEITKGLTTVLISHRFSTVRHADRIVVMEDGRVAEQGSHDALMQLDGKYAAMFRLQASAYVEADEGTHA